MGYKDNIMAIVIDEKVTAYAHRKVAVLRKGGDNYYECPCGKEVHFSAPKMVIDSLVAVFHDEKCYLDNKYNYMPKLNFVPSVLKLPESKKREPCPECGGKAYRKGYQHYDGCSLIPPPKEIVTCDECGGRKRGKGFSHKKGCSLKPSVNKSTVTEFCDECNGPKRGKGFSHTEECSMRSVNVTKKPKPTTATCPSCGGPRRGRGYTHTEDCKL